MRKLKPVEKTIKGDAVYINASLIFQAGHGMKTTVPGVFAIQEMKHHDREQIFSLLPNIEAISKRRC